MDFRILKMMILSLALSIIGMCCGSLLGGGYAIALLQILFPFVIVIHSIMQLYGLAGIAVTTITAFVLTWSQKNRTKMVTAVVCAAIWTLIAYHLDKGYTK
ncbi:hypothetical protein E4633_09030 [Geomonas terrae]|uniref:Uncharacterized protein n=1 Tax=Geomonas terrae TaxID=2562681 RepID=A0A4S1CFZ2_9BACT|nr:hypothetical protein E4633_09030 [Geomonas terrae]